MMQVINLLFKPNCFEKTEERGQKKLKNKIAHNVLQLVVRLQLEAQIIKLKIN